MIRAEGVKFFVDPVLAIDDERLMRRHVEGTPEILEQRRRFGLEAVAADLVLIDIAVVAAGQYVKRAVAVARRNPVALGDPHVAEQSTARDQLMHQEGAIGAVRIDRFAPPHAAAEADDDDVRTGVAR